MSGTAVTLPDADTVMVFSAETEDVVICVCKGIEGISLD
jgi:hypothetical protein